MLKLLAAPLFIVPLGVIGYAAYRLHRNSELYEEYGAKAKRKLFDDFITIEELAVKLKIEDPKESLRVAKTMDKHLAVLWRSSSHVCYTEIL